MVGAAGARRALGGDCGGAFGDGFGGRAQPVGRRSSVLGLALLAGLALASDCGGGDGGGGRPAVVKVESPDPRCTALPDPFGFPPGYDFFPEDTGRVLATTFSQPTLVPLDVSRPRFRLPEGADATVLPDDADGDGCPEFAQLVDDATSLGGRRFGVTLSGYEAVLFADVDGGLAEVVLEMPPAPADPDFDRTAEIDPAEFLFWPEAGTSEVRTGLPNFTCIVPADGAVDSRGDVIGNDPVIDQTCPRPIRRACPDDRPSYRATFTSGVARAAGRLFVAVSNLGEDRGTANTQYLPAALTVYAWDDSGARPRIRPIPTPDGGAFLLGSEGTYNYSHVQAATTAGGRTVLLASASGAIGIVEDDPSTPDFEAGATRLSEGRIDVFDPAALQLIARYRLRRANPAFNGWSVDPSGRIAAAGDVTARFVYAVDLTVLDGLPDPPVPGAPPAELSGDAVLFDGRDPLVIPHIEDGAPEASCPGRIDSVAWNFVGDRLYAVDVCDGTLTGVLVERSSDPPRRRDFEIAETVPLTAPLRADTLGLPRQPSKLKVRGGRPGVDFDGPDLFFLVNEPEGLLCGIAVESS